MDDLTHGPALISAFGVGHGVQVLKNAHPYRQVTVDYILSGSREILARGEGSRCAVETVG
jgi:hypothetical protein